ncbi:hypothetical protein [Citrobacter phage Ci1]|nr:hypothetical protein [Citrobacter phage Ci1]
MLKVFVLTMALSPSTGGAAVTTHEYPLYQDCQAAASAFVSHTKRLTAITYVNAWCTVKNIPVEGVK